jgi:hypothetical protein
MPDSKPLPLADLLLALLMLAVAMAMIWGGAVAPGPAAFPLGVAAVLIVLALGVAGPALIRARAVGGEPVRLRHFDQSLLVLAFSIAYFAVLELALAGFQGASVGYIFLLTAQLFRWPTRHLPGAMLLAEILGLGLQFAFTHMLFLDLR